MHSTLFQKVFYGFYIVSESVSHTLHRVKKCLLKTLSDTRAAAQVVLATSSVHAAQRTDAASAAKRKGHPTAFTSHGSEQSLLSGGPMELDPNEFQSLDGVIAGIEEAVARTQAEENPEATPPRPRRTVGAAGGDTSTAANAPTNGGGPAGPVALPEWTLREPASPWRNQAADLMPIELDLTQYGTPGGDFEIVQEDSFTANYAEGSANSTAGSASSGVGTAALNGNASPSRRPTEGPSARRGSRDTDQLQLPTAVVTSAPAAAPVRSIELPAVAHSFAGIWRHVRSEGYSKFLNDIVGLSLVIRKIGERINPTPRFQIRDGTLYCETVCLGATPVYETFCVGDSKFTEPNQGVEFDVYAWWEGEVYVAERRNVNVNNNRPTIKRVSFDEVTGELTIDQTWDHIKHGPGRFTAVFARREGRRESAAASSGRSE